MLIWTLFFFHLSEGDRDCYLNNSYCAVSPLGTETRTSARFRLIINAQIRSSFSLNFTQENTEIKISLMNISLRFFVAQLFIIILKVMIKIQPLTNFHRFYYFRINFIKGPELSGAVSKRLKNFNSSAYF